MRTTKRVEPEDSVVRIDTRKRWFNWTLIILCFLCLGGIRLEVNRTLTGDEPHYMAMDYALVHNHNLNLVNVYQNNLYYSWFPFTNLQPQNPQLNTHPGKVYSTHGTGLPLLLAPGFFVAAKTGAVFEMTVLATVVVWLTWVWTYIVTKNRKVAYLASFMLTICYFFNGLVGAIYPDMLIAAISLAALIMLERYYKKPIHQVWLGILLGFLVLVHIKTLNIVLPVLAVLSYKLWQAKRNLPWISALIVLVFVGYYFVSFHHWFGIWSVSGAYGSVGTDFHNNPAAIVAAQLFDSTRGLLVYNPILLLVFVGLPLWFKRHRETFLVTLVVLLPSMAFLSTFNQWHGGQAPLGRYIIDFLPAFIPALAFAIMAFKEKWQKVLVFLMAAATFLITLDGTLTKFPLIPGNLTNPPRTPLFTQIYDKTHWSLDRLFPTYSTTVTHVIGRHGRLKALIDYLVVIALVAYGYWLSKSSPKKREVS